MELTIKTRKPGIPTQQARETGAPWTDTEVNYFFTSNNSIGLLGSSNSFNKVKTQTAFSTKILKGDSKKKLRWPVAANTVTSSQVEGFVCSTGCLSTYAARVVLSHQLHRGLGGRLWPTGDVLGAYEKTAVALKCLSTHSAVGQSFTSDYAQAVAVYRSSGHAISQLLSRNKSVVSAHAQVARFGHKRRSQSFLWHCTQALIDLYRYCTGHGSVRFSFFCLFVYFF